MLFDGAPELPIATLRPSVHPRRTILVDLGVWLAHRRAWLRPRVVPLLAALVGFLAPLGAVKAIGLWSHRESLQLAVHATQPDRAPARRWTREELPWGPPVLFLIQPLGPNEHVLELTISAPDPR